MNLAPIVVFAFNRLDLLKPTIDSLRNNPEAKDSDLIVFVDGPRKDKPSDREKVEKVREYVRGIEGFKSLTYHFAEENKGLAPSIIGGVSEVIKKYGTVIVVEDDLYVSRSFLSFINQMLSQFKDDKRVMQVSGYCPRLNPAYVGKDEAFMNGRAQCWSWATWLDRWETIDWEVKDFERLKSSSTLKKEFNTHGSDLFGMLKGYMEGSLSSWFVRFAYSMHKQGRFTICPTRSLVRNDGFGGEATHCKNYDRYKIDFDADHQGEFKVSSDIHPNPSLMRNAIRYWSMPYRIYGKIMTLLRR